MMTVWEAATGIQVPALSSCGSSTTSVIQHAALLNSSAANCPLAATRQLPGVQPTSRAEGSEKN